MRLTVHIVSRADSRLEAFVHAAGRLPLSWLDPGELRVGLGCMRLSTDADRDEERALATIVAAVEAGITVFDTARAYGDNEQLLAPSAPERRREHARAS